MATVRSDAETEGYLFTDAFGLRLGGFAGNFDFAFPLERDEAPPRVVHLRQVLRRRQDTDLLTHTINLFHSGISNPCFSETGKKTTPAQVEQFLRRSYGRDKRLENKGSTWLVIQRNPRKLSGFGMPPSRF